MIRELQLRDLEQAMRIWLEGKLDAHSFIPRSYWESKVPMVREQLLQAEVCVYGQAGEVLGFAGMQGDYLAGIFVDAEHRSRGIGKLLLNHVRKHRRTVFLHVYQRNEAAVHFYRRAGFSAVSESVDEDTGAVEYTMVWNGHGRKGREAWHPVRNL